MSSFPNIVFINVSRDDQVFVRFTKPNVKDDPSFWEKYTHHVSNDTRLDTAMRLLRDAKGLHIPREMNQADHDVLREAKEWK